MHGRAGIRLGPGAGSGTAPALVTPALLGGFKDTPLRDFLWGQIQICIEFYARARRYPTGARRGIRNRARARHAGASGWVQRHTSTGLSVGADSRASDCASDTGRFVWFVVVGSGVYVSPPTSTGAKLPPRGVMPRNRSISLPNSPFSA